jgi:integrase
VGGKSKRKRWPGGYVHRQADGRELFIIEREIREERFHVSTRAHNLTAAMKQLERFESNPGAYRPQGDEVVAGLLLTNALVLEHRTWSLDVRRNTWHYANEVARRLFEWMEDLKGVDLRNVSLRDHIKPALERRKTSRRHRIIALKAFYGWLRKEKHLLSSAEDATLDLPVPQAVAEKTKRRKVVEAERIRAAWSKLEGPYRDMLEVLAATGMHVTELERFIRDDEAQLVRPHDRRPLGVLVTRHKSGALTRIPLGAREHVAAAERLKARGTVPRWFRRHLRAACEAAGVEPFNPGVLRHSVATFAVEHGATPDQVSRFLGHRDKRTTERFYVDTATPTEAVPVPRLKLVKG